MPGLAVRTNQNGRRPERVGVFEFLQGQPDLAQVRECPCLQERRSGVALSRFGREGDDLRKGTKLGGSHAWLI